MALVTYSDLKAEVSARLARGDVTDAMIADYITLAEADFNLSLKSLRRMLGKTTITIVNGAADLPSDFQSVSDFQFQSRPYTIDRVELGDLTHDAIRPPSYAIGDKMYFGNSATPTTLDLYYYKKIPALSDSTTNWLYQNYPQIYLDATLYHGFKRLRNNDLATQYYQLSSDNIQRLKNADQEELSGQTMQLPQVI